MDYRFYDPDKAVGSPDFVRPVRVGRDRRTGKIIVGWPHVQQSIAWLFQTRFHSRPLRRYVGSFVPHMLGENLTERTIGRFYWSIGTSLDLWEPNYRLTYVNATASRTGKPINSPEQLRMGHFEVWHTGQYRPRGHLGDATAEVRKSANFASIAATLSAPGSWKAL